MRIRMCLILLVAPLLYACGEPAETWTHELHADNIQFLSVPAFQELPKDEEMWKGRDHLFAAHPKVRVLSTHGFWTRVKMARGETVYVPSNTLRPIAEPLPD